MRVFEFGGETLQSLGYVGIVYNLTKKTRVTRRSQRETFRLRNSLPMRLAAAHICYNAVTLKPILLLAIKLLPAKLQYRMRIHFGSHTECSYSLASYGIPITVLPIVDHGGPIDGEAIDGSTCRYPTDQHMTMIERMKDDDMEFQNRQRRQEQQQRNDWKSSGSVSIDGLQEGSDLELKFGYVNSNEHDDVGPLLPLVGMPGVEETELTATNQKHSVANSNNIPFSDASNVLLPVVPPSSDPAGTITEGGIGVDLNRGFPMAGASMPVIPMKRTDNDDFRQTDAGNSHNRHTRHADLPKQPRGGNVSAVARSSKGVGSHSARDNNNSKKKLVTHLNPQDVLLGRGRPIYTYGGNVFYYGMVSDMVDTYEQANKKEKTVLAESIVEKIKTRGGRFLKLVSSGPITYQDLEKVQCKNSSVQDLQQKHDKSSSSSSAKTVGVDQGHDHVWEEISDLAARRMVAAAFRTIRGYKIEY